MIKTSCQFCGFRDGLSCRMGVLQNFADKGKVTVKDDYHIINGVCLYHKNKEWCDGRNDDVSDNLNELKTPVSFIVVYSNIDDLNKTLPTIKNHHVVVAVENAAESRDIKGIFAALKDNEVASYNVVGTYVSDDFEHLFAESFKRVKNGYCTIVNAGFEVPEHWMRNLNRKVAFDQNIILGVLPINDINGLTVYSTVFKMVKGNRDNHYFKTIIEAGGSDYIKEWGDI